MEDPGRHPGTSYVTFELLTVVAIGYRGQETTAAACEDTETRVSPATLPDIHDFTVGPVCISPLYLRV